MKRFNTDCKSNEKKISISPILTCRSYDNNSTSTKKSHLKKHRYLIDTMDNNDSDFEYY